jgi:hypothetical protein
MRKNPDIPKNIKKNIKKNNAGVNELLRIFQNWIAKYIHKSNNAVID